MATHNTIMTKSKMIMGPPQGDMQNSIKQHRTTNHSITGHITNAVQILG